MEGLVHISFGWTREQAEKQMADHEAQVRPLTQEITIHIDAVRLAQILGDKRPYGWEVPRLQGVLISDIMQLCR